MLLVKLQKIALEQKDKKKMVSYLTLNIRLNLSRKLPKYYRSHNYT